MSVILTEVKSFLRIDADYAIEDVNLQLLIDSAIDKLEGFTGLGLISKERTFEFNGMLKEVPYGPNPEISSVVDSNEETLSDDMYTIDGFDFKRISIKNHHGYYHTLCGGEIIEPVTGWSHQLKTYKVTYTSGYSELPALLKHALLIQIDYDYYKRGTSDDGIANEAQAKAMRFSRNLVL